MRAHAVARVRVAGAHAIAGVTAIAEIVPIVVSKTGAEPRSVVRSIVGAITTVAVVVAVIIAVSAIVIAERSSS